MELIQHYHRYGNVYCSYFLCREFRVIIPLFLRSRTLLFGSDAVPGIKGEGLIRPFSKYTITSLLLVSPPALGACTARAAAVQGLRARQKKKKEIIAIMYCGTSPTRDFIQVQARRTRRGVLQVTLIACCYSCHHRTQEDERRTETRIIVVYAVYTAPSSFSVTYCAVLMTIHVVLFHRAFNSTRGLHLDDDSDIRRHVTRVIRPPLAASSGGVSWRFARDVPGTLVVQIMRKWIF